MKAKKIEIGNFYQKFEVDREDLPEKYIQYREFSPRSFLFEQEEKINKLFFVLEGVTMIGKNLDLGDEQVNYLKFEPCILGIDVLAEKNRYNGYARAISRLKVIEIDANLFLLLLKGNKRLHELIRMELYKRLIEAEDTVLQLHIHCGFPERFKKFLLKTFSKYGEKKGGTKALVLKIRHKELALYLKASRQSVTTMLNVLRKSKIIDYSRDEFVLLNVNGLILGRDA